MVEPGPGKGPTAAEDLRLTRRELWLIVAFWALYGLLTVANRIFDPGPGPGPRIGWISGPVVVAFTDSVAWAALTPGIFWLAGTYGPERERRGSQLALFGGVGVAVAVLLTLLGGMVRHATFAPPGGPGRPPGPPAWFGFLNALVMYLGVLAAGLARAYSLRYRARREQAALLQSQLAEAHLAALRRQLDPHFLFNTLNAVSSLVERDPRGVRRMIARLSELLRHSLEGADAPEIPLRDELELLGRYLDIMQVRFQGRLEVGQRVDPRALDGLVPTLVLQPLVENAIRHGTEKLDGGGRIGIEAELDDETMTLRVTDNGPPGPAGTDAGGGVGLRNTIARLERLYGGAQRFTLTAGPEGGMIAEVRLPFRSAGGSRAG